MERTVGLLNTVYGNVILFFCIFTLAALSGMFSERAGIINIAINGFMVVGGVTYRVMQDIMTRFVKDQTVRENMGWQIPCMIVAAAVTALFALLHGLATIKLKSDHTISGFAMNLLAVGFAVIFLSIFGHGAKNPNSPVSEMVIKVKDAYKNYWEIVSLKLVVTVGIIIAASVMLYKTKWGLRFRSVGENPQAADVAGININRYKWQGIIISGLIAGVAGAIFSQKFPSDIRSGDVKGYGYIALAIMIMGQWKVGLISIISFVFSLLYAFSTASGSFITEISKYKEILNLTPYIVTLIVIMVTAKNSRAPAASGIIYDKSKR